MSVVRWNWLPSYPNVKEMGKEYQSALLNWNQGMGHCNYWRQKIKDIQLPEKYETEWWPTRPKSERPEGHRNYIGIGRRKQAAGKLGWKRVNNKTQSPSAIKHKAFTKLFQYRRQKKIPPSFSFPGEAFARNKKKKTKKQNIVTCTFC